MNQDETTPYVKAYVRVSGYTHVARELVAAIDEASTWAKSPRKTRNGCVRVLHHFPLKPRPSPSRDTLPPRQASILGRVTELNARSTVYQRNCGNLERRNNRGERVCAPFLTCVTCMEHAVSASSDVSPVSLLADTRLVDGRLNPLGSEITPFFYTFDFTRSPIFVIQLSGLFSFVSFEFRLFVQLNICKIEDEIYSDI